MSSSAPSTERSNEPSSLPLLRVRGLTKHFPVGSLFSGSRLHAVDDVDLEISQGEIVGLVGESGSGKSTVARLLARLYAPTSGKITLRANMGSGGDDGLSWHAYRRRVQMVFQDPYSFLNPVYPVSHGLMRALKKGRPNLSGGDREEEAKRLLELVGLTPAEVILHRFPHELSGGQRQRIGFAQALACEPELILADEPVSMLDVSIRVGILNLMRDLRQHTGVSFLYITHDLASARYVSDRLMVMYAGQIVEGGRTEDVLAHPKHPYTELLLSAVPDAESTDELPEKGGMGEPPRVINPAQGCRFRNRCPHAFDTCQREDPERNTIGSGHFAACHLFRAGRPQESASGRRHLTC